jgi:hypothetical protein
VLDMMRAQDILREWLSGRRCLKTTVNVETGSDLLLDFGKWIEYRRQSASLKVTHRGEFRVMIICVWQIDGPWGTVIDSGDVHEKESWQDDQTVLEGLVVRDVELTGPWGDLALLFQDGYELRAFCEIGEEPENWFALGPRGEEIVVDSNGRIQADGLGSLSDTT